MTPLEKEYSKQLKLLKKRAKSWEKKYHIVYNIPKTPKTITKKSVEKLKNIQYKNFTDSQKKKFKREYNKSYDNGDIKKSNKKKSYSPPTENDYIEQNEKVTHIYEDDFSDDDALDVTEEYDAWVDDLINEILILDGPARNQEARNQIYNILWESRHNLGDKAFYDLLSKGDTVTRLHELATRASMAYLKRGQSSSDVADSALLEFAYILNNNTPLTIDQTIAIQTGERADIGLFDDE